MFQPSEFRTSRTARWAVRLVQDCLSELEFPAARKRRSETALRSRATGHSHSLKQSCSREQPTGLFQSLRNAARTLADHSSLTLPRLWLPWANLWGRVRPFSRRLPIRAITSFSENR